MDTLFRRELRLDGQPQSARLSLRTARYFELKINGTALTPDIGTNWKDLAVADVAAFLRSGPNVIEVRVFNDSGPPALWLLLETDSVRLQSDQNWQASIAGSAWRPARLATSPSFPERGSLAYGGEQLDSLSPKFYAIISIAVSAGVALVWTCRKRSRLWNGRWPWLTLGGVVVSWLLLFCNNAVRMPFYGGFDAKEHLDYIEYVRQLHKLPWPTEGFEMFQPPFYYVLSAILLTVVQAKAGGIALVLALRCFSVLAAIAHFILLFLSARLLYPQRIAQQVVALLLGAFLPMQLYLSHYLTNEVVAATMASAALYLGLRLLQRPQPSLAQYALVGLFLGLALLSKTTALLLAVPLFAALLWKSFVSRSGIFETLGDVTALSGVSLAVCGWRYGRIWARYGTPLLGNWDAASGFSWWQDPGFHVVNDFARFGRSLTNPLFSGLNGFWDGLYSTLWGDALCGGAPSMDFRPPWNYDLLVGGNLLAIVPTALVLIGAVASARRFLRQPTAVLFLLLSASGLVVFGIVFMTLRVASYAQIKSFYGLIALIPICLFGANGWAWLTRKSVAVQAAMTALLLAWAANSFATYWILPSPGQHLYMASELSFDGRREEAAAEASKAVALNPENGEAHRILANIFQEWGRPEEASKEATRSVELRPNDSRCRLCLAKILGEQGQSQRAIDEGLHSLELGPQNLSAYKFVVPLLLRSGRLEEAVARARDALAIAPFSGQLHNALATALARSDDFAGATSQFGYAMLLLPSWKEPLKMTQLALSALRGDPMGADKLRRAIAAAPDSAVLLNEFAWFLATNPDESLRNGAESLRLAKRASLLSRQENPAFLNTIAAAQAELGDFDGAIRSAEAARSRAEHGGEETVALVSGNLLESFRQRTPYREEPNY